MSHAPGGRDALRRRAGRVFPWALLGWLGGVEATVGLEYPEFWATGHDVLFARASSLYAEGRLPEALETAEGAIAAAPEVAGYLSFSGWVALELGRPRDAKERFERALRRDPGHVEARMGLATALVRVGEDEAARVALRPLGDGAGLDPEQRFQLARLLGQAGAHTEALALDLSLVDAMPEDGRVRVEAVRMALALHRWALADGLARELAESAGAELHDEAVAARAAAQRAMGNPEAAWRLYGELGSDQHLRARAELAVQLEHFQAAIPLLEALLRENPTDRAVLADLAWALDRTGSEDEAEARYRALLSPVDPESAVRLARLLAGQRRYAEAWDVLARVPTTAPDDPVAAFRLDLAVWSNRRRDVVALAEARLAARPDDRAEAARLWRLIANAREADGDLSGSLAAWQRVILTGGRTAESCERTVRLLVWTGDEAGAGQAAEGCAGLLSGPSRAWGAVLVAFADGDYATAANRAIDAGIDAETPPELLVLAARVATAAGRPALAREALAYLDARRPLDGAEQAWFDGLGKELIASRSEPAVVQGALAAGPAVEAATDETQVEGAPPAGSPVAVVSSPAEGLVDSGGVLALQAGLAGAVPTRNFGEVRARVMEGVVIWSTGSTERRVATAELVGVPLVGELTGSARAGVESLGTADPIPVGSVRFRYDGGLATSAWVDRDTLLPGGDLNDPRGWNRVLDPGQLTALPGVWRVGGDVSGGGRAGALAVYARADATWYDDGNAMQAAYVQVRVPLAEARGARLEVRPDAYAEHSDTAAEAYFSPAGFGSGGVEVAGCLDGARWGVELAAVPKVVWTGTEVVAAGELVATGHVDLAPARLEATVFTYTQGDDYQLARGTVVASFALPGR